MRLISSRKIKVLVICVVMMFVLAMFYNIIGEVSHSKAEASAPIEDTDIVVPARTQHTDDDQTNVDTIKSVAEASPKDTVQYRDYINKDNANKDNPDPFEPLHSDNLNIAAPPDIQIPNPPGLPVVPPQSELVDPVVERDNRLNITKNGDVDWHSYSVDQLDEIYRYNYEAIEERFKKRRQKIGEVCTSINNKRFGRPFLFYFRELGISWCPTYKASSTNWKDYFVHRLIDPNMVKPGLDVLWKLRLSSASGTWPDGRKKYRNEPKDTIRYTVVRHPIVRVISYFKMAQGCGEYVRTGLHQDIMLKRPIPAHLAGKKEQFKKEVDAYHKWCERVDKGEDKTLNPSTISEDNPYLNPPHITFNELIERIKSQRAKLKGNDWEGHWAPASEWCDMCTHKLDYVAKLENEPWELWFLMEKLGLWADRALFLSPHNKSTAGRPSAEDELKQYVDLLGPEERRFLNEFYKNDYNMFGYSRI